MSRLDIAEERISELEDMSTEIFKTEKQRLKNRTEYLRTVDNYRRNTRKIK